MQSIFFKEHEGIHVQNPINGGALLTAVPRWSGLGSYGGEAIVQSKLATLELSTGAAAKGNTNQFTLFSGNHKTSENGAKTQLQMSSPIQAATMEHPGTFEIGYGQPMVCTKYPYGEQYYGVYSTNCGTQIAGRMMLPLSMSTDQGGPIFVNAKQYNGIMRRRKKRAEKEMENRVLKLRKPYLHHSRHLHAMRRPRGNGGRFLNKKKPNDDSNEKTTTKRSNKEGKHLPQQTESQTSEVLQSGTNGSRSTSPGSEVTSHVFSRVHPFQFNHLQPGFHHFLDVANTELGIAMDAGNYLKFG
uniref:Nuclear transcription factor Y subunit n=1 Tax=Antirrhinum majus TaxID=4151 RepID=A5PGU0_ANTMA|nr:YA1 [Antirrhinum majus]